MIIFVLMFLLLSFVDFYGSSLLWPPRTANSRSSLIGSFATSRSSSRHRVRRFPSFGDAWPVCTDKDPCLHENPPDLVDDLRIGAPLHAPRCCRSAMGVPLQRLQSAFRSIGRQRPSGAVAGGGKIAIPFTSTGVPPSWNSRGKIPARLVVGSCPPLPRGDSSLVVLGLLDRLVGVDDPLRQVRVQTPYCAKIVVIVYHLPHESRLGLKLLELKFVDCYCLLLPHSASPDGFATTGAVGVVVQP